MKSSQAPFMEDPEQIKFAESLIISLREPVVVISEEGKILAANDAISRIFETPPDNFTGEYLVPLLEDREESSRLNDLIHTLIKSKAAVKDFPVILSSAGLKKHRFRINANYFPANGSGSPGFLLCFQDVNIPEGDKIDYRKLLSEVLSEVPALICTLRGPDHKFELANDKYLALVEYREIIGKPVKEILPEVENQGFIKMLDKVYDTGEAFIGKEIKLDLKNKRGRKSLVLDFVYQPIKDASGKVEGIFVHAIDVTEKVLNRQSLENSEKELRNLIDTVPVIIWISNAQGEGYYLNKNWYLYTGQSRNESSGFGWLSAVHPEDRDMVATHFKLAHEEEKEYYRKFRLYNKNGYYRWVIDRGRPKWNSKGEFEGLIGTVTDVHDDHLKEQVIKENEHRIRSIVEQATVATAVYMGEEMKIELANDAMLNLWGKGRSVIGTTLRQALPELEGQPFHDLLLKVFTTGEIYWGKEDRVDLMKNGQMVTGYYNFTYKPLRNEEGEIIGILNMALDVTEMVESKNLLKERERHFRLMADLMPEKVINTDAGGEAIYFNKNWLDYTGMSFSELKKRNWESFIHPQEEKEFNEKWQYSLETGSDFEMELRLQDRNGEFLWHLSRAEAVRGEDGEVAMWIGTNTQIQKLKEEEKRKEDFLKMVSHELKTPVTSIKGYVQLLLNFFEKNKVEIPGGFPIRPSLERIDNQVVRLTRLIAEILDLSRLEEDKLDLKKEVFDLNELVEETVQDIKLTNTQHQMDIFHTYNAKVCADKDRIGQVLINFITNAIKYSPESQYIEIHILKVDDKKVGVSVRDKGIGIDEKYHKNIFKRFYRIGVESDDTYSGFGIGLYLANEIIERHNGYIEVKSKKGEGSDFSFVLLENKKENE
ncbi:PAS domain S-box protein [Salinimicrobium sediminilitoris]|uniref:PAS domain S-box protein n=1 Tax=Salinimicrobium sediminilitoris TaxID=2876715 RepID=UPI001E56C62E|nr:PAS domain S-box protein [Salinimicrobium sediminilitoris]MCC8360005.1 PAS domain S-box protein [Salinimicrobium sediminilitoris]